MQLTGRRCELHPVVQVPTRGCQHHYNLAGSRQGKGRRLENTVQDGLSEREFTPRLCGSMGIPGYLEDEILYVDEAASG
jgi:hypothetical protein